MSWYARISIAAILLAPLSQYASAESGWTNFVDDLIDGQKVVFASTDATGSGTVYTWRQNPDPGNPNEIGGDPFEPSFAVDAFATPTQAMAELSNNAAGWVLLRRGDVWPNENLFVNRTGPSSEGWLLVGAYLDTTMPSSARPVIDHLRSDTAGFPLSRTALVSLKVLGANREALRFVKDGAVLHIEDIEIPPGNGTGMNIQDGSNDFELSDVRIRRCIVYGRYEAPGTGGRRQGLYAHQVDGLLIEECILWHNGWTPDSDCPWSGNCPESTGATTQNHNVYLSSFNNNVVVRGNTSARASSHSCLLRPGGLVEDNLFLANPINLLVQTTTDEDVMGCGIGAVARYNVILEGADIDAFVPEPPPRGFGLQIGYACEVAVYDNIIAHQTGGSQARGIHMDEDLVDVSVTDNIVYRWTVPAKRNDGAALALWDYGSLDSIEIADNDFQQPFEGGWLGDHEDWPPSAFTFSGNAYWTTSDDPFRIDQVPVDYAEWNSETGEGAVPTQAYLAYPDPERNIDSYLEDVLGVTPGAEPIADFMNLAIQQSKTNWNPLLAAEQVNCYMRAGFWPDDNPCPSDLNSDNVVDVSDLLILLGGVGPVRGHLRVPGRHHARCARGCVGHAHRAG